MTANVSMETIYLTRKEKENGNGIFGHSQDARANTRTLPCLQRNERGRLPPWTTSHAACAHNWAQLSSALARFLPANVPHLDSRDYLLLPSLRVIEYFDLALSTSCVAQPVSPLN